MAPNAIICSLCGGKYFRASLPHHQKVCAARNGIKLWECEYCAEPVPLPEVDAHLRFRCANAPAETVAQIEEEYPDAKEGDLDGREACTYCERKFNKDRLAKHEVICARRAASGPRPKFDSSTQRRIVGAEDDVHTPSKSKKVPVAKAIKKEKPSVAKSTTAKVRSVSAARHAKLDTSKEASKSDSKDDSRQLKAELAELRQALMKLRAEVAETRERAAPKPKAKCKAKVTTAWKSPIKATSSVVDRSTSYNAGGGRLGDLKPKILPSNASSADNPLVTGWQC